MLCANGVFSRCMPVSSFFFIAPLVLFFFFFCEPELVGHLRLLRMATTLFLFLLGCFRFRVSMYGVWAFFLPLPLFSCRGLLIAFGGGRPLWAMFRNLR